MELSPICKKEYPALRALYRSAFPAAERMPLSRFFALQKKGQAEILVLRTGGAFAGLMIVSFAPGYALLNYFAVEPDCRSMGLGSRRCPPCSSVIPIGRWCWRWSRRIIRHPTPGSGNGGWISMPKTAFSPATCRYGCAAWHWMYSHPAGRHWILPPIKGFIARSLAVWRPFLCKSANKTPPGQILLVFWPGVV